MATPTTPTRTTTFNPTTPIATPAAIKLGNSQVLQSSPHYTTTRRHSLYGTEDRVVIDPGSRIWKVGFSGEGKPREVFYAEPEGSGSLWNLERAADVGERTEEDRTLEANLERCMRFVFHKALLTDPKSRKIILVEQPLMPIYIKDMIARILFNNLQVPSISFASSHLLSLLSVGRITGLVLDCGHLESTALPIFAARPLYPHLRTTPLAGSRLSSHLRALLLLFGTYLPPPSTLSAAINVPAANRATRVPQEVLTDAVIEDIKTRLCFVSEALPLTPGPTRLGSPTSGVGDDASDFPPPPSSDAPSETESAGFEHASAPGTSASGAESAAVSEEFSVVSHPAPHAGSTAQHQSGTQALAMMYMRHSAATDVHLRVVPPLAQQTGTGRGTLIVPGWIRERAAEVLFEGGDVDESSVAEVVLDALLKAPVDLRRTLASSILVVGGTPMLSGFIPRLQAELVRAVGPRPSQSQTHSAPGTPRHKRPRPAANDRYAPLRPLLRDFAILNNPAPRTATGASSRAIANAGKAPAFAPATMAWVGGSLAGSLKTGGVEVPREKWDESTDPNDDMDEDELIMAPAGRDAAGMNVIPDWTRSALPIGAPPAVVHRLAVETVEQAPPMVEVT
ncbi:actin-like ATPase domain-containing protein [Coniophora puteana RWD-64-598 SS2]|uniref:Actin-like ATPase domain-containing protein n=1 Tax=Coniophora puteana (strain RWD-64-598) TaxID=741705 RepID=A0A5M3MYR1_CONPW|nr:actin-like ATPase domain-containing protein [Coniophora puteana RWD-64-598 SS2]EIW83785.1 actin-like ATPase domain-containing protein [Coniophora puteana RWD-64-598 SS2]